MGTAVTRLPTFFSCFMWHRFKINNSLTKIKPDNLTTLVYTNKSNWWGIKLKYIFKVISTSATKTLSTHQLVSKYWSSYVIIRFFITHANYAGYLPRWQIITFTISIWSHFSIHIQRTLILVPGSSLPMSADARPLWLGMRPSAVAFLGGWECLQRSHSIW